MNGAVAGRSVGSLPVDGPTGADDKHRPTPPASDTGPRPDRSWHRPALALLLVATGALYLWDLGSSGWANSFYSAAVQAGTESWTAMFFGSSDAANLITVDKPPLSLWPMVISARIFGLGPWSVLVPQALMGVGAVAALHATVRRWHGPVAGLVAGAVLALTPVAALMFRFNNPDASLVLLLTLSAYALVRSLEHGSRRWVLAAGALVGLAFLAKSFQAFLVVPGFASVYLLAAPGTVRRRLADLALAGAALVVAGGWWVAAVELWPTSSRPYIGGSQSNSFLELLVGYNGLGRLTGDETGSVVPGGGGGTGSRWGSTGLTRLFDDSYGGQASWLLPAALLLLVALLAVTVRRARTDRLRASVLLWGSWLVVTGLTISLGQGIIHEYYTVALAPPLGALVGIGVVELWRRRRAPLASTALAVTTVVTVLWAAVLLGRTAGWTPWLRPTVLVLGLVAALLIGLAWALPRRWALAAVAAGGVICLAGPAAYALETASTPHSGSLPTAGPAAQSAGGGPAGGRPDGGPGGFPDGVAGTGGPTGTTGGGLLASAEVGDGLAAVLAEDAERFTWIAAAVGANNAAGYQLATGEPVMSLGGFNGSDPWPTLEVFQQYVADGQVHWFVAGGGLGAGPGAAQMGGSDATSEITAWVEATFEATTVDGVTLYDLRASGG